MLQTEEIKLQKQGNTLINQSKVLMKFEDKKYILKSEEEKVEAGILLKEAAALKKKINDSYKKIWDAHKETGKRIKEEWEEQLEPSKLAYLILSQGIGEFNAKVKREAEEKARIERERIEQERIKQAKEKAKQAEELKKEGTPESMVEAINLETEVEDLLDLPDPIIEVKKPEKISGTRQLRNVKVDIVAEYQLRMFVIQQIQQGKLLQNMLKVNESAVRQHLKAKDGKLEWPGTKVQIEYKTSITGR